MSEALWDAKDLASVMEGEMPRPVTQAITSISIDTRTLEPGALFFAIRGDAQDGHAYVRTAVEKGAAACVIERARAAEFAGQPVVLVEETLRAMEALGRAGRDRLEARYRRAHPSGARPPGAASPDSAHEGISIAVTGSVGKTSTKEMLKVALGEQGPTHASVASYNNHWGVPLTLARTPAKTAFAIYEIGMSNPFEILPLTSMVRPHIAIVTTVEPVHLAQFRSIEAIADAKGEIFSGIEPGGVALINADNPQAGRLKAHAAASRAGRICTFGAGEGADIRMLDIKLDPDFSVVSARVFGQPVTYRIGAAGRHFAMNSLAVLGAAKLAGADLALSALALAQFGYVEGRGQRLLLAIRDKAFTLIDESYNANPSSMRAALAVTGSIPRGTRGRRIAVLGDMLELGVQSPKLHAGLEDAIIEHDIDLVFASGEMMRHLFQALPAERRGAYAESAESLVPQVLEAVAPGDVVVIKGSNGSRMSRVVAALKGRYPLAGIEA